MRVVFTCFEVSSRCNMDCKFCFSEWRKNKEQLSTEKAKHVIDVLASCGLKAINLTGGDPLLRNDIVELVKYCKEKGLMTIISTNGILLPQKEEILKYVDSINLPLDSFKSDIHNKMRPCAMENHHGHILKLIDFISEKYPKVKIKINTMVGKCNIDDIPDMIKLLGDKVLSWKLGKFFASGYGKDFKEDFDIDDESYQRLIEFVRQNYKDSVVVDESLEQENEYDVFIDGRGRICELDGGKIVDRGEIDNLPSLHEKEGFGQVINDYLNEVYKYGGKDAG